MSYTVKEIYYTLQGEGTNAGRAAVFLRFTGCNLWSGLEVDRETAVCSFCDTDFVGIDGPGGGRFDAVDALARAVLEAWPGESSSLATPLVVCTGGEPLLQLDSLLIESFHRVGFEVAVETNGTLPAPPGIDWICVSPKADAELLLCSGHELKLVYPQEGAEPEKFSALRFDHFFLQPMDGPHLEANVELAVHYCQAHPQWRLSLQTHKYIGIP